MTRSASTRRAAGRQVARVEQAQSAQVVQAAGNAIVTAARVGRLLGRSGWRIARQIPMVTAMEQQAQRMRQLAAAEMFRLLELPQGVPAVAGADEQRTALLVHQAGADPEPLRSAMTELLERSTGADGVTSRDYLFGTIVSQLVPDEARILAAMAGGGPFAAVDVVAKHIGRSTTRTVLTNVSTVGRAAGITLPQNVATYLTRLHGFGLLDFAQPDAELTSQFDALVDDPAVQAARSDIDAAKLGSPRVIRKSVSLSALGREFWQACAPSGPQLSRHTS